MKNGNTQTKTQALLRALPGVDSLLLLPAGVDLVAVYGRPLVVEALRAQLREAVAGLDAARPNVRRRAA